MRGRSTGVGFTAPSLIVDESPRGVSTTKAFDVALKDLERPGWEPKVFQVITNPCSGAIISELEVSVSSCPHLYMTLKGPVLLKIRRGSSKIGMFTPAPYNHITPRCLVTTRRPEPY